jgi:hypothetical protein
MNVNKTMIANYSTCNFNCSTLSPWKNIPKHDTETNIKADQNPMSDQNKHIH